LAHEISVSYTITNGTARPNIDYIPTNGTVSLAANFWFTSVDLSDIIFDNGTVDSERTVLIDLQNDNQSPQLFGGRRFHLGQRNPGNLVPDFTAGRLPARGKRRALVYGPLPMALPGVSNTPGGQWISFPFH
jgi:hypothetical protein